MNDTQVEIISYIYEVRIYIQLDIGTERYISDLHKCRSFFNKTRDKRVRLLPLSLKKRIEGTTPDQTSTKIKS